MKYFRKMDTDAVVKILEDYKKEKGEYPTTNDFAKLKKVHKYDLPSIRWVQKNGGILLFYKNLGLHYTDARTGFRRSEVAYSANKKSQSIDVAISKGLEKRYGESNVHWQSPYNSEGMSLHRSDFKVYKNKKDFFFVDLFFPKDMESLQGCVNIKLNKLLKIKVENSAPVYLISCNEEYTSPYQIDRYLRFRKKPMPKNVMLLHISDARLKLF